MTPTGAETPAAAGNPNRPRLVDQADQAGEKPRQPSYDNEDHVKLLIERCRADAAHNPARLERDVQDIGNHRMYRGGPRNQWIYRPRSDGTWEERPFDGDDGIPAWIPRCTTNDFANRLDGVTSLLAQSNPAKTARPATTDDEDVAAADVAQKAIPVIEAEVDWPSIKRQVSHLCVLSDKVLVVLYYDNDPKHGTAELPIYQCEDCAADEANETGGYLEAPDVDDADGTCPDCGGSNVGIATHPDSGLPLPGLTYATGKLCARVANSFGFSLPSGATSYKAKNNPWFLLHDDMQVEECASAWPKHAEYFRSRDGAGIGGKQGPSTSYAHELRGLSSPLSSRPMAGASRGSGGGPILVYRLQHDPITDDQVHFPEGLYAVMAGDRVLEAGPLPIKDSRTGQYLKSGVIRTFRDMPGTPFGKPPADDLFPLQIQKNLLESIDFLSAMHHAAPTVYLPESVTLVDQPTGQPGQHVRYRSMDPSAKPTIAQGSGAHPTVKEQIVYIDEKMDKLSGLNAVLQGARPEGSSDITLGETQILQERGMSAFYCPFQVALDFEQEFIELGLEFARQCMWAPRFFKIKGDDGAWDVEQFIGSEIAGNVDIVIDPLSAWPKSPMMQDLRVSRATELGIIAPAQDPELAGALLDQMSLGELKPSLSHDRKQVARELDRWRAATVPQEIEPPDPRVIEVPLHLFLKKQFLKTENAEQLKLQNRPVWEAMVAHVGMLQQFMAPAPAPAPGDGKDAPPDGRVVDAAVQSGALVPEGAGGNPLENALAAGAISPEMPQGATGPSIDDLIEARLIAPAPPEQESHP